MVFCLLFFIFLEYIPPLNNHPQDIKLYSDDSGIPEIPLRPQFQYLSFIFNYLKKIVKKLQLKNII